MLIFDRCVLSNRPIADSKSIPTSDWLSLKSIPGSLERESLSEFRMNEYYLQLRQGDILNEKSAKQLNLSNVKELNILELCI